MHVLRPLTAGPNNSFNHSSGGHRLTQLSSAIGLCAMATMIAAAAVKPTGDEDARNAGAAAAASRPSWTERLMDPNRAVGAYGGIAHTLPDTIRIQKDGAEATVRGFDWIGKPFVAPIYYGARVWRWSPVGQFGTMVDFIHAKAIAKPDSVAEFTGTHNGQPLPKSAKIKDVFSKLEFSHGHNILTYNGLLRLGTIFGRVRPYVGAGAGVSLPHTEVGFAKGNTRTFEYQFAGFAGQGVAGLEIDLGQTSIFLEYKFTYAPHDVPLSHEPKGSVLPVDLWRQFSAWWRGEKPPGGRLTVNLTSHHGVAGMMVKTGRDVARLSPRLDAGKGGSHRMPTSLKTP
jgi:lipid A oxidase